MALEWVSLLFGVPLQKVLQHLDLILIEPQAKDSNPPEDGASRYAGTHSWPTTSEAPQPSREGMSKAVGSSGRASIQIGQIKDLIWKLSLKPFSAPFKVVIIDQAHLMNQEAQTCLLKTLEEPKGKSILILITEYPEMLFPTILSRVQKIRFSPVEKVEIEDYLKSQNVSDKKSEEISKLSLGEPGVAVDFVRMPEKIEIRNQKIKELIEISKSDLALRFRYAKELSKERDLGETLNIWLNYFRNLLIGQCSVGKEDKSSLPKLKNILKQIQNISYLISTTNINPRLALEILMLEL